MSKGPSVWLWKVGFFEIGNAIFTDWRIGVVLKFWFHDQFRLTWHALNSCSSYKLTFVFCSAPSSKVKSLEHVKSIANRNRSWNQNNTNSLVSEYGVSNFKKANFSKSNGWISRHSILILKAWNGNLINNP